MGKEALFHRDDGTRDMPGQESPWEPWVSATKTRNFILEDPLLDWLDAYGMARGFREDTEGTGYDRRTDFLHFVFEKGRGFEAAALAHLGKLLRLVRIANSPDSHAEAALNAAEAEMQLAPEHFSPLVFRGSAHLLRASIDLVEKKDPGPSARAALADFDRVIAIVPSAAEAHANRGNANLLLARSLPRGSPERAERWEEALRDAERALACNPRFASAAGLAGRVRLGQGEDLDAGGEDGRSRWRQAVEALTESLRLDPFASESLCSRALAWSSIADAARKSGEDPRAAAAAAVADWDAAFVAAPGFVPRYLAVRADQLRILGEARRSAGEDARETALRSVEDFRIATRLAPHDASLKLRHGMAAQLYGNARLDARQDPVPAWMEADAAYGETLKERPGWSPALTDRGTVRQVLGEHAAATGKDGRPWLEQALADYRAAAASDPRLWQARVNEGTVLELLGRWREAVAAYEAAQAVVGDGHPPLREMLARARARAR